MPVGDEEAGGTASAICIATHARLAGDGGHGAVRGDGADGSVGGVGNVNIAIVGGDNSTWLIEERSGSLASVEPAWPLLPARAVTSPAVVTVWMLLFEPSPTMRVPERY